MGALGVGGVVGQKQTGLGGDQTVFFNAGFVEALQGQLIILLVLEGNTLARR
jgi:hypothetical protein